VATGRTETRGGISMTVTTDNDAPRRGTLEEADTE